MKFRVPESEDSTSSLSDSDDQRPTPNQQHKKKLTSLRKSKSSKAPCIASAVRRNEHTPSPFADPPAVPARPTSIASKRSTLRIRLSETPSSDSEQDDDGEDIDSEEEQWPVRRGAPKSHMVPEQQDSASRACGRPTFLVPDHDALQVWDQQARQSTYQLSLAKAIDRRKHFEQIHARTLAAAHETQLREHNKTMNELSEILNKIGIDHEREVRLIAEAFEQREKRRNDEFEELVRQAEKIEEEEGLRAARLKQEEAARKAELIRKEAQKKLELEERRKKMMENKLMEEEKLAKYKEEKLLKEKEETERENEKSKYQNQLKIVKDRFENWCSAMQQIKAKVLPAVSSNENRKTLCRHARRQITTKVSQLTGSAQKIEKLISEIGDILQETKSAATEVYIWTLNHLSKSLIKQSETEATCKLGTVYPLARLVVGLLLVGHAELGDVLMARLVKKCYLVTAYHPRKAERLSVEEYKKMLGYAPEHVGETAIQYGTRMSGVIALYAAICQTDPHDVVPSLRARVTDDKLRRIPRHFRLDHCWQWIVYMLKPPVSHLRVAPVLLSTFILVAGERMFEVYGRQWIKLLDVGLREGIRKKMIDFDWEECKPAIGQLEAILEEVELKGIHRSSEGRLYDP